MPEQRLWAPWRMRYVQGERDDEGWRLFERYAESGDCAAILAGGLVARRPRVLRRLSAT